MELLNQNVEMSFNLYNVSDIHIGSIYCVEDKFKEVVKQIEDDPIGIVYLNGDLIQGFIKNHKNWEHTGLVKGLETPIEQAHYIVELLRPIRDKIVAVGMGNHELSCQKNAGDITRKKICTDLDVPYGGYSSVVTFKHKKKFLFNGYFHHGFGSINSKKRDPKQRREANENALVNKLAEVMPSNCAFGTMGHTHKLSLVKPEVDLLLTNKNNKLKQLYNSYDFATQTADVIPINQRFYGNSGTFEINILEGINGYAEMAGYAPAVLGCLKLEVRDGLITDLLPIYK